MNPSPRVSLVLSGGVALGAYQAGAYAALHHHEPLLPSHIAASSIGAVNAALIAGNRVEARVARLETFWEEARLQLPALPALPVGPWRHAQSWAAVLHTRLFGRLGQFHVRLPELMFSSASSVYDLEPLGAQMAKLVDFERLNRGTPTVAVLATDIETGEGVLFDTRSGAKIGPEHLLASCGFLPDFAPVEIGGRLLGDGGLAANAPIEAALDGDALEHDQLCFVVDLFSSRGERPVNLEQAAARRFDLLFGNQTRFTLQRLEREHRLRTPRGRVKIAHLAYRAPSHQAGPEKPFDYSRASLDERWNAGYRDMEKAIELSSADAARTDGSVSVSVW